jgi:hypothetical protein
MYALCMHYVCIMNTLCVHYVCTTYVCTMYSIMYTFTMYSLCMHYVCIHYVCTLCMHYKCILYALGLHFVCNYYACTMYSVHTIQIHFLSSILPVAFFLLTFSSSWNYYSLSELLLLKRVPCLLLLLVAVRSLPSIHDKSAPELQDLLSGAWP